MDKFFIVEVSKIPRKDTLVDTPLDNPVQVYNTCIGLKELCEQESGIGIAAAQVGVPWNLFLVKGDGTCSSIKNGEYGFFVNCQYEAIGDELVSSLEGCLSLRSLDGRLRSFYVTRPATISVKGKRLVDTDNTLKFVDFNATLNYTEQALVFQHELDHSWKGLLISDIGKEMFVW